jgi:hypothetical protein
MLALLAGISLLSEAAEARVAWQGHAMITAVSAGCAESGDAVGQFFTSVFRPPNIDDNGPDSWLSFVGARIGHSLMVSNGTFEDGVSYDAVGVGSFANHFSYGGNVQVFSTRPSAIDADTRFIAVTGRVTNWMGNAGCTVMFDGSYVRRR